MATSYVDLRCFHWQYRNLFLLIFKVDKKKIELLEESDLDLKMKPHQQNEIPEKKKQREKSDTSRRVVHYDDEIANRICKLFDEMHDDEEELEEILENQTKNFASESRRNFFTSRRSVSGYFSGNECDQIYISVY